MRIAHLTSVHPRHDTRIFLKMCRSLAAAAGHEVFLIVADGQGDETREGVRIVDVGRSSGRLGRMIGATRRGLAKAIAVDADIYHLHDPELMPVGLALKRRGKTVIYDAHEDLPQQILSKPYLHPWLTRAVSFAVAVVERFACRRFDAVIGATPVICQKLAGSGIAARNINNFPMLGELESEIAWSEKGREVCYVGGIASIRGVREVVTALGATTSTARLNLVGDFSEPGVKTQVAAMSGWGRVNELGFLSRIQVREVLARSVAGIVTFLPVPNHVAAQPNKMFEYMSAGLPVIASNFPLWREIIEGSDCGICVDPLDPGAIAAAIDRLVEDPALAQRMGANGRRAVQERYNWAAEERKLLDLYEKLLPKA